MNRFKEWLNDFKYLSKSNQIQIIVAGIAIFIGLAGTVVFFTKNLMNNKKEEVVVNLSDYFAYSYQETGDLSVVNLNKGDKVLSSIKISNTTISKEDKEKISKNNLNPYKIIDLNEKLYVLNYGGEIVELSYSKDKIKELRRIKVDSKPIDFKIYDNNIYISYLDSSKIDIFDINSGKKTRSFETSSYVTSFELADNKLYIGTKDSIEVMSITNASDKNTIILDEEFPTTEIFLSKDKEEFKESSINKVESTTSTENKEEDKKENKDNSSTEKKEEQKKESNDKVLKEVNTIYALNNFANDNKNSVVIKLQEGLPVDILGLEKENPIHVFEGDKYLYVTCRGLENDKEKDALVVINKKNFKIKKKIILENAPNYVSVLDENTAFVSHDNGEIIKVDLSSSNSEGIFKIVTNQSSLIKRYTK